MHVEPTVLCVYVRSIIIVHNVLPIGVVVVVDGLVASAVSGVVEQSC